MKTQKSLHIQAFWTALLVAVAIFLPFVIYNGGYFIFIGDFNAQQIPFYKQVHRAIREGNVNWSWTTDLGANFLASYSFYNVTSPFFWLTLPFPTDFVPHLMAPLLCLKHGCAALTSYFWFKRFVRDQQYALLASVMYAFSGFMFFNIFFNHFHEVAVFFPLMLIGMEELVKNNRRGLFAAAVAINAIVNYWFFIGSAVFCVLYFFLRCFDKSFGASFKKFCWVGFEAILGIALSAVTLLPSVLAIMGNPRTTADNLLNGWNFWLYWHEERYPAILGSFLFPPHVPSRPVLFPNHGAKWASLSGWFPLFGAAGTIAYLASSQKSWLKKALWVCLFVALVPGLNSLFVLFNNSYYARWFYALTLLMALATVLAMEKRSIRFEKGLCWAAAVTVGMVLAIGLTPVHKDGEWSLGLHSDAVTFWLYALMALACLVGLALLFRRFGDSPRLPKAALAVFCAVSVLFGWIYFTDAKNYKSTDDFHIKNAINGGDTVEFPSDGNFVRTDYYDATENLGMYWNTPTIQAFHSIVPVSIMEFYPEVGVTRDVSSYPETKLYALRSFLSARWLVTETRDGDEAPMPGYSYIGTYGDYHLFENDNHVPMGFTFEHFITREEFDDTPKDYRCRLLMKGLMLEDEQIETYSHLLSPLPDWAADDLTEDAFRADCADRRREASYQFTTDNDGFTCKIMLQKDNLVFFSVPYEKGWTATVNGRPAQIIKADIGFMAVEADAGDNTVRFTYRAPGLKIGASVSGVSLLLFLGYVFLARRLRRRPEPSISYTLWQNPEDAHQLSFEELLEKNTSETPSQEE